LKLKVAMLNEKNLTFLAQSFVANFVGYISAKYYLNWLSFHVVIMKVIGVNFFETKCTVYASKTLLLGLYQIYLKVHSRSVMPGFHHSVAVLPLPLRRCRSHLPLRRNCHSVANRIESYFCRSAVGGQPISVLVSSSLCIRKDVSSISVLTRNGNGSYGTEERQRYNGTAQRNKGTAKRQDRQRKGGNQE